MKAIFGYAAGWCAIHTGLAAAVSHSMGGTSPISTGFSSLGGAFAGAVGTYLVVGYSSSEQNYGTSGGLGFCTLCGMGGYVAGSAIGFALKHS